MNFKNNFNRKSHTDKNEFTHHQSYYEPNQEYYNHNDQVKSYSNRYILNVFDYIYLLTDLVMRNVIMCIEHQMSCFSTIHKLLKKYKYI